MRNKESYDKGIAWCPKCGDELSGIELKDEKGMIEKDIYQCFGCDKWFELTEFDIGDRVFGSESIQEKNICGVRGSKYKEYCEKCLPSLDVQNASKIGDED